MGCNAWNHWSGCDCGWGGHGRGRVWSAEPAARSPAYVRDWSFAAKRQTYESFTNPNAKCPVCGAAVYFYQSPHGGRVFFDAPGQPWPKHPCTDNSGPEDAYPKPWKGPASQAPPAFVKDGWEPIFEARWRPWLSSTYSPGVLTGFLGARRASFSVTFPFGTALDTHAPLLGKVHVAERAWLWVDAPYFQAPVLGCEADPRSINLHDLAKLAGEISHGATLVKLADMCGFERDDVPGRADFRRARQWLEVAAELGDWRASNNLGVLYECGLGMPADADKALTHYRRAARSKQGLAVDNMKRLEGGRLLRSDSPDRGRHVARVRPPTLPLGLHLED